jgi:hypothetical protein
MAACLAECYADGPAHVVLGLYEKAGVAMQRSTEESNAVMAAVTAWKFGDSMEPVAALGYLANDHSMLMMLHQIYAHFDKKGWLAYLADGEKWRESRKRAPA